MYPAVQTAPVLDRPAVNSSSAAEQEPGGTASWRRKLASARLTRPVRNLGAFFAMALDVFVGIFTLPLAWREYLHQSWFVARVSLLPAVLMMIPYSLINTFIFNILLNEFGAADFSGAGAAFFNVNQIGPLVTVLVTAGASATAMCADLGARTIREELDAQRVMGIDPIQALVIPRVLAATTVSVALNGVVVLVGMVVSLFFCSDALHVSPGAFVSGMTVVTGLGDVVVSLVKSFLFGLGAGLIACYKGISVRGGPAGVGNAVNETVVFSFMVLFSVNIIVTAIGVQFTLK